MTEGNSNTRQDKDGLPEIKAPTLEEKLTAAIDHTKDIPDIKRLMEKGKGVHIDTDTGEVSIIDDDEDK